MSAVIDRAAREHPSARRLLKLTNGLQKIARINHTLLWKTGKKGATYYRVGSAHSKSEGAVSDSATPRRTRVVFVKEYLSCSWTRI